MKRSLAIDAPEYSTYAGAVELRRCLIAFWAGRGRDFQAQVIRFVGVPGLDGGGTNKAVWAIASNARNGMPPRVGA